MSKVKLILLNICCKVKKILFTTILCLCIVSMLVTPKTSHRKFPSNISLSEEEELVNFALDHNQCLSYGHSPDTFEYHNCMEKLQKQRQAITTI